MTTNLHPRSCKNALVLGAIFLVGNAAGATALAEEEHFSVTYSNTGTLNKVDFGPNMRAYTVDFITSSRNDSGKGFLHNITGHCIGMKFSGSNVSNGHGYCTFTDQDGDKLFERWESTRPDGGTITFLDGTGKYSGFTCDGEWSRVANLKPAVAGTWQNIGRKTGSCKKP